MHLDSADAHALARGKNFQLILFANRAGNQCAGHHHTKTLHAEDPVNGQAGQLGGIFRRNLDGGLCQRLPQVIQTRSGQRTDGDDGGMRRVQKRIAQKLLDLQPHHVQRLAVHLDPDLVSYRDPPGHGEEAADIEVLASLWFDRFIGRDHEQDKIDAAHAGQHIFYKTLVARDIDETQPQTLAAR